MITIDGGMRMGAALENMGKFGAIARKLSPDRLMGFIDGMQENTSKGRFSSGFEPVILWEMRNELKNKIGKVEDINLTNYFGAYANGYLFTANPVGKFLDYFGKEKTKYSCAMDHLEIPFRKKGRRFRSKNNIYGCLDDENLLIYDDRDRNNFKPRFRLEIE